MQRSVKALKGPPGWLAGWLRRIGMDEHRDDDDVVPIPPARPVLVTRKDKQCKPQLLSVNPPQQYKKERHSSHLSTATLVPDRRKVRVHLSSLGLRQANNGDWQLGVGVGERASHVSAGGDRGWSMSDAV